MEKENRIIVDHRVRTHIKRELKLGSYPTIRKALDEGYADKPQLVRIREAALELGGVMVGPRNKIEDETTTQSV